MSDSTTVKGTCMRMCPESEIEMREREGLLHPLECQVGGVGNGRKKKGRGRGGGPRADRSRAVKAFSRSAAGRDLLCPDTLRPPPVLRDTVGHLITIAASEDRLGWPVVYQFVADRLRAVRQDAVVQRLAPHDTAMLLQPMVRFHAYAAYRLCEEGSSSTFDPHLNRTWLNETLKHVLACYDEMNKCVGDGDARDRDQMEALYGALHLGNVDALHRLVSLDPPRGSLTYTVVRMSLAHLLNNFIVICQTLRRLPPLLACVAALHLPLIRRRALSAMSVAYSSRQQLRYPAHLLSDQLLYCAADDAVDECRRCGLNADPTSGITFDHKAFDPVAELSPPKRLAFIDTSLRDVHSLLTSNTHAGSIKLARKINKKNNII